MRFFILFLLVASLTGCANLQLSSRNGQGVHINSSGFSTIYTNGGSQITRGSNGQTSIRVMR